MSVTTTSGICRVKLSDIPGVVASPAGYPAILSRP
jgi:hypothetical protein